MRCPNPACACPVNPADDFCPNCGKPLDATTKAQSPGPEAPGEVVPVIRDLPTDRSPAVGAAPDLFIPTAKEELASRSDCPDLEVQYNNNCVFVMNMQSTFDLMIRPQADGIRSFYVEVRQSGRRLVREEPMEVLKRGVPVPLSLNYTPLNTSPGSVAFNIVVGYRLNGQPKLFVATRKHTLHSGKEDPRRVCESLVIEVKNNIQQGHAGDIKVDQDFKDLKNLLGRKDSLTLDKEFIGLINQRPIWTPLPLAECEAGAAEPAGRRKDALPPRLLLQPSNGDGNLLLSLQSRLQIGRARECDVVTRSRDASGQEDPAASQRLSRFHACVEWRNQQAVLMDRGYQPGETQGRPSVAGVWVDGKRLAAGGEFLLRPGRDHQVSLDDPAGAGFGLSIRLWTVGEMPVSGGQWAARQGRAAGEAACVVVKPSTGFAAKSHVLVRHGVCLDWLVEQGGSTCICRQGANMCLVTDQGQEWLATGQVIRTDATDYLVLDGTGLNRRQ